MINLNIYYHNSSEHQLVKEKYGGLSGAIWLTGQKYDLKIIDDMMNQIMRDQIPIFVLHTLTQQKLTQHLSDERYLNFIKKILIRTQQTSAIWIIEPFALAQDKNSFRNKIIKKIVTLIRQTISQSKIYIDIGHSNWLTPQEAADLLIISGIENADGFSLNVSSHEWTGSNICYGEKIKRILEEKNLRDKNFVIDTSQNGNGPFKKKCDPQDERISTGPLPSLDTPYQNQGVDAFLWINSPGYGDGCTFSRTLFKGTRFVEYNLSPKINIKENASCSKITND